MRIAQLDHMARGRFMCGIAAGSVPTDLTQSGVELVGNYAISIRFSDGHQTGIYPFRMLRENDPALS